MQEVRDDFQKWQAFQEGRIRQIEEQEQAKRHQLQAMLPLPRRVAPRLSEDLTSMIVRTAHVMGYPQPDWILRPQKVGHAIALGELALLQRPLDYELLMRLLDLDQASLHRLTLHHFATRVQGTSAVRPAGNAGAQEVSR